MPSQTIYREVHKTHVLFSSVRLHRSISLDTHDLLESPPRKVKPDLVPVSCDLVKRIQNLTIVVAEKISVSIRQPKIN